MGLASFNIDLDALGRDGKIEINGTDVARSMRVTSVAVQGRLGETPRVFLECVAEGHIEGEGIVEVRLPAEDDRASIIAFLEGVDPEALEKAVLEKSDWGSGSGMALALHILVGWARGDE